MPRYQSNVFCGCTPLTMCNSVQPASAASLARANDFRLGHRIRLRIVLVATIRAQGAAKDADVRRVEMEVAIVIGRHCRSCGGGPRRPVRPRRADRPRAKRETRRRPLTAVDRLRLSYESRRRSDWQLISCQSSALSPQHSVVPGVSFRLSVISLTRTDAITANLKNKSTTPTTSNPMLTTALTWKNARLTRLKSSGRTSQCS